MRHDKSIDWEWVKEVFLKKERVLSVEKPGMKRAILACADECLRTAKSRARPKTVIVKKTIVDIGDSEIGLEGGVELSTRQISSFLKGATHLYIMAVTIGRGVEEAATGYMEKGDVLSGYLLDRIGSFACESLAESVEENLRAACAPGGLSLSARFSPGYCDWRVEEQFKLDKMLDLAGIGVTLNKNYMMVPKKSITAIAGLGPKGLFKKKMSQCGLCRKIDCDYRRGD